jgi:hypothetical protein
VVFYERSSASVYGGFLTIFVRPRKKRPVPEPGMVLWKPTIRRHGPRGSFAQSRAATRSRGVSRLGVFLPRPRALQTGTPARNRDSDLFARGTSSAVPEAGCRNRELGGRTHEIGDRARERGVPVRQQQHWSRFSPRRTGSSGDSAPETRPWDVETECTDGKRRVGRSPPGDVCRNAEGPALTRRRVALSPCRDGLFSGESLLPLWLAGLHLPALPIVRNSPWTWH